MLFLCGEKGRWSNIAIKIKKRYQGRQREINNDSINEMIRFPEVRVLVDSTKETLGVLKIADALKKAEELELDLVLISDKATPPVCKIVDYGKFRFERKKQEQQNKKRQKLVEIKEVRISTFIDKNDLENKLKQAKEFILKGNKVKISLKIKKREQDNKDIAEEKIKHFIENMQQVAKLEKDNRTFKLFELLFIPIKK